MNYTIGHFIMPQSGYKAKASIFHYFLYAEVIKNIPQTPFFDSKIKRIKSRKTRKLNPFKQFYLCFVIYAL